MKSKWLIPSLLCSIAILSHLQWFNPFSTLTHGDWGYWNSQAIKELWYAWGTWLSFNDLGSVNIQISFYFFKVIWSALAILNIGYDISSKVTFFLPIAILGFLSPYFLAKKLFKDNLIAFCCALFYGSTTYFLVRQTGHIPIALVYALTPLVFLVFFRAIDSNRLSHWIQFGFLFWISSTYELRITYIISILLAGYYILFHLKQIRSHLKNLAIVGALFICLSLFWIIPTALGGASSTINKVANRGLFGNNLFDIQHALSLSDSAWTGTSPNEDFISQPIPYYLWLIPILIITGLVIFKNQSNNARRQILYFLLVVLVGVFLTKQSGHPIELAYNFLYNNLPSFNLFREASKFYLITAFGFFALLGYALLSIKNSNTKHTKYLFYGASSLVILVSILNLKPLVTLDYGTLFVEKSMPDDYVKFQDFIRSQDQYFRVLWYPSNSRWGFFDLKHPRLNAISTIQGSWLSSNGELEDASPKDLLVNFLKQKNAGEILDSSAVKYVVVPTRDVANADDVFRFYELERQTYIDELDNVDYLKKIDVGTNELAVYENINYLPYISATEKVVAFKNLNDLQDKSSFTKHNNFGANYTEIKVDSKLPFQKVEDLFTKDKYAGSKDISLGEGKNSIYYNLNATLLAYKVENDNVILHKITAPIPEISGITFDKGSSDQVSQFNISGKNHYLIDEEKAIYINPSDTSERKLGVLEKELNLYSASNDNLIPNPSFKDGLWNEKVEDCDNYSDHSLLNMSLENDTPNGDGKSVKLESALHISCTGPEKISILPGDYLLEFDYKGDNSIDAGYTFEFNDPSKSRINKRFTVIDRQWKRYSAKVSVPVGATEMRFRINTFDQILDVTRKPRAGMYFTGFRLSPLALENNIYDGKTKFEKQNLPENTSINVSYKGEGFSLTNLINNGSLEDGLWKEKVGDCNAIDDHPLLKMSQSNDASNGNKSLQLEAKSHTACTGQEDIPVKEGSLYTFSFDYQSPNSSQANYYIGFDDEAGTTLSKHIGIKDIKWNSYNVTFRVPYGATQLSYAVYSSPTELGNKYSINRYDNFSLIEIPDLAKRFYLVNHPKVDLTKPKDVYFESINPSKKQIHIKGATTPFFLAMSESYNDRWRLEINDSSINNGIRSWSPFASPRATVNNQFKLDDFLNGWYVDVGDLCKEQKLCKQNEDGSYDIEMVAEFTPQRWFYFGSIISGVTFIGVICYLGYEWQKNRKHKKDKSESIEEKVKPDKLSKRNIIQ